MRRLVWRAAARSPGLPRRSSSANDRLAVLHVEVAAVLELRPDLRDGDTNSPYGAQLCLVSIERIGDLELRLGRCQLAVQDGGDSPGSDTTVAPPSN